ARGGEIGNRPLRGGAAAPRCGPAAVDDGLDLAAGEQLAKGAPRAVLLDRYRLEHGRRRRIAVRLRAVGGALHPVHAGEIDAVFVLQHAADENCRRLGGERRADALALEVLRLSPPLAGAREEPGRGGRARETPAAPPSPCARRRGG